MPPALHRTVKKNVYACTSSLKAWNRLSPSGSAFRRTPHRTRITASWKIGPAAFTHYYFYVRVRSPTIVQMALFSPFHATYYLNGHSLMEQELKRNRVGSGKDNNAFLAANDISHGPVGRSRPLSPEVIRKQLDD
jgi:hypothetical protein